MTNGPEKMRRAGENLEKINKLVKEGKPEKQVTFPLSEAALTLRIPKRFWQAWKKEGKFWG